MATINNLDYVNDIPVPQLNSPSAIGDALTLAEDAAASRSIVIRVLPAPANLQSSIRRSGATNSKLIMSPFRVRWCASTRNDPAETLSVRRRAFKRLRDACMLNPQSGLSQDENSIAKCMEEADLLPAANLERLRCLLYALPAAPWCATRYPVVFDVEPVLEIMGTLQRAYRWWHVRLNFVITFIPRISLSEVLQQLIRLHGSDAAAAGFHHLDEQNSLYPMVLFLPGEPRALEPQGLPTALLRPDRKPSEELHSVSTTTDSDCEEYRPPRPKPGTAIPKIEIKHMGEWCDVLRILRSNNAWSALLCSLIDEGLAMLAAQGFIALESLDSHDGCPSYCNASDAGGPMPPGVQPAY